MGAFKNAAIRDADEHAIDNAHTLDAIREILDRERAAKANFCECDGCKSSIGLVVSTNGFECTECGYTGRPRALDCSCTDGGCHGNCGHGTLICPACDDGEGAVDPWEIVREVRAALAG